MRLIIARHGETEENRQDIVQGQMHGTLSRLGIEQAKKLALRLKGEQIDFIYSSDLARASDTAFEIAKYHPNAHFELTDALRERHLGEHEGKKHSEVGWDSDSPSAESREKLIKRIGKFVKLIKKNENANILLVCHGGSIEAIIAHFLGKAFADENKKNLKNAGITIIEIEGNKAKLCLFNSVGHL